MCTLGLGRRFKFWHPSYWLSGMSYILVCFVTTAVVEKVKCQPVFYCRECCFNAGKLCSSSGFLIQSPGKAHLFCWQEKGHMGGWSRRVILLRGRESASRRQRWITIGQWRHKGVLIAWQCLVRWSRKCELRVRVPIRYWWAWNGYPAWVCGKP